MLILDLNSILDLNQRQEVERMNKETLALMDDAKREKGAADSQHVALTQVPSEP